MAVWVMFVLVLCLILVWEHHRSRDSTKKTPVKVWDHYQSRETALEVWDKYVKNIPNVHRTTWVPHGRSDFSAVLIEFRDHPWMEGVLNNMASVYGDKNVSLVIVHGIDNCESVRRITRGWEHVALIRLPVNNIDIEGYNNLLTDYKFWEMFKSKMVLIFQTDTLIRKPIDKEFFSYDYVGSPWSFHMEGTKGVGNGGWSLRNVSTMKSICREHNRGNLYEDVFFSRHCYSIPTLEVARRFGVETLYYPDPCGLHKPYAYHDADKVRSLLPILC